MAERLVYDELCTIWKKEVVAQQLHLYSQIRNNTNLPGQLVLQPFDTDTSPITVRCDRYLYHNVNVSADMSFDLKKFRQGII